MQLATYCFIHISCFELRGFDIVAAIDMGCDCGVLHSTLLLKWRLTVACVQYRHKKMQQQGIGSLGVRAAQAQ